MIRNTLVLAVTTIIALVSFQGRAAAQETGRGRPNVILILTNDQSYGEVAAHGQSHDPVQRNPKILAGQRIDKRCFHCGFDGQRARCSGPATFVVSVERQALPSLS